MEINGPFCLGLIVGFGIMSIITFLYNITNKPNNLIFKVNVDKKQSVVGEDAESDDDSDESGAE